MQAETGNSGGARAASAGGGEALAADTGLLGLEHALLNACETLSEVARVALDFSYDSQDVLFTKVNGFVKDLAEIDAKGAQVNHTIPLDVLEAIDRGRNPEQSTFNILEACAEANNVALGKLKAMTQFRDALDKELVAAGISVDEKAVLAEVEATSAATEAAAAGGADGATA